MEESEELERNHPEEVVREPEDIGVEEALV